MRNVDQKERKLRLYVALSRFLNIKAGLQPANIKHVIIVTGVIIVIIIIVIIIVIAGNMDFICILFHCF